MRRIHRVVELLLVLTMVLPLETALAQADTSASPPRTLVGTWRGTSTCRPVGKPACHDEIAVYHFRHVDSASASATAGARSAGSVDAGPVEHLVLQGNKVVNGVEEEMGTMKCTYDPASGNVVCPMRDWRWVFRAVTGPAGITLTGTLRNPAGVVWRDIRVTRSSTIP